VRARDRRRSLSLRGTRDSARDPAPPRVAMTPGRASRLLVVIRLTTERARQAVRQDCSLPRSKSLPLRSSSSS
jgi:hypothetical protein